MKRLARHPQSPEEWEKQTRARQLLMIGTLEGKFIPAVSCISSWKAAHICIFTNTSIV